MRRWQESEITHGRVAMLAALGFVVGEQLQDFPLFFNFDGRVSGECWRSRPLGPPPPASAGRRARPGLHTGACSAAPARGVRASRYIYVCACVPPSAACRPPHPDPTSPPPPRPCSPPLPPSTGPAIYHFQQIGQGFWEPLLVAIGVAESYRVAVAWATPAGTGFNALKDEHEPGKLGFDPLNLAPADPAAFKELQTKEINNGRLAMIAIAAFVAQELVEQTEIFEHLFLRFEKEAILGEHHHQQQQGRGQGGGGRGSCGAQLTPQRGQRSNAWRMPCEQPSIWWQRAKACHGMAAHFPVWKDGGGVLGSTSWKTAAAAPHAAQCSTRALNTSSPICCVPPLPPVTELDDIERDLNLPVTALPDSLKGI